MSTPINPVSVNHSNSRKRARRRKQIALAVMMLCAIGLLLVAVCLYRMENDLTPIALLAAVCGSGVLVAGLIGVWAQGRPKSPSVVQRPGLIVFNTNWPVLDQALNPWHDIDVVMDAGDYRAAETNATKAIQANQDDDAGRAIAHVYRGIARLALGDRAEALHDFEAARELQLNRITQFAMTEAYHLLGDFDRAIADFSRLLHNAPGYLFAAWQRAEAYFQIGEYTRALADWYRAERLEWPCPHMYRIRRRNAAKPNVTVLLTAVRGWAHYYSTPGHTDSDTSAFPSGPAVHEQAIVACSSMLAGDPEHAIALGLRGAARWHLGHLAMARADLDEAIRLDARLSAAFRYRGLVLQWQGEYQPAITDLSEAARLAPDRPDNHARLASLLASCPDAKLRDLAAAVAYGTLACEMSQWKDPDCLTALAVALAAAGKFTEAITWQHAALLFPGYRKRRGAEAEQRLRLLAAGQPYPEQATVAIPQANRVGTP